MKEFLKEASEDFDNLESSTQTLAVSIEDHINDLDIGKSPKEILDFLRNMKKR